MKNLKKSILLSCLTIFAFSQIKTNAETLSFESLVNDAVNNSYDLKIANISKKLSKEEIKNSRADYLPTLKASLNTDYTRDLTKGTAAVSSVGTMYFQNTSQYQTAAALSLSYTLYDFGMRGKKLEIAKKDAIQKDAVYLQKMRDLKLNILDLYSNAYTAYIELKSKQNLFNVYSEMFQIEENLYNSGKINKVEVSNQAMSVAKTLVEINQSKIKIEKALNDLSYYTLQRYNVNDIDFSDITQDNIVPVDYVQKLQISYDDALQNSPEFKQYQMEIEKKKAELSYLKRQNLPQFGINSNYYFYGSDKTNFIKSYSNLGQRNLSLLVYGQMPVFDGFKNKIAQNKAKLEIEQLKLQKEQKLCALRNLYDRSITDSEFYKKELQDNTKVLSLAENTMDMVKRLNDAKLTDKISLLKQKSQLIQDQSQQKLSKANNDIANLKLKIISEVN